MSEVWVTGVGAVTGLGEGADRLFAGLLAGESAIGRVPSPFGGKGPVAAIPGGPHLTSALAVRAVAEALGGLADGSDPALAVVGGSTSGDLVRGEREYEAWRRGAPPAEAFLWAQLCDRPTDVVARTFGARGPRLTLSTACASGASAVGVAFDLVRSGRCARAVAFGADALCALTVHGFGSLGAIAPAGTVPFQTPSTGLSLGEGAAALLLESPAAARARGAAPLARIGGYGTAADAWHATAPHPEGRGARAAIRAALAGLAPEAVGYVNAHGTGTPHNDAMERKVLAEELPEALVASVKGAVGHTLGAAGAVELVVTVLALARGLLPPNPAVSEPFPRLLQAPRAARVAHAVSVNFAFGGVNAAVRVDAAPPTDGAVEPPPAPRPWTGRLLGHAWRLPAGVPTEPEALRAALLAADAPAPEDGFRRMADPAAPAHVSPGDWRRASRLTRACVAAVDELLARFPDLDRARLPVVYGSAMGEVVPSSAFLDRLFAEGPRFASAFAFQNSVWNATPGHVGHLFGLTGPTETLSAGLASGLAALARGLAWAEEAGHALVLAADDLNETTEAAYRSAPGRPVAGEAVVAVLVGRGEGPGVGVAVAPGRPWPGVARAARLPYEPEDPPPGEGPAPERTLGLCCTNGLVALLAGLDARDHDSGADLAARRT